METSTFCCLLRRIVFSSYYDITIVFISCASAFARLRLARCSKSSSLAPATRKRDAFKDEEERIWRGADAATLVRDVLGLENAERVDEHCKMLWKMRKDLIDEGLESGAVRSDTINDLEAILVKLRYLLDPAAATRYKLIATSAPRRASAKPSRRSPTSMGLRCHRCPASRQWRAVHRNVMNGLRAACWDVAH